MDTEQVVFYGILSVLPPLIAIALSIWSKQVIPSLFLGVFSGALIINNWNPGTALLDSFEKFIVNKGIGDPYNSALITFCIVIGGMVGIINKSGGIVAVAASISKRATSKVSSQMAALVLGTVVFIDDYASCLITGNTMRPITDAQRISREKLAFITDATAAAISSVIPISTWIATELGLIKAGLESVGIDANPLMVFVETIPARYYVIFLVVFMVASFLMRREYGPMLKAEMRSYKTGEVYAKDQKPMQSDDKEIKPDEGTISSMWNAVLPIVVFIVCTVLGLWYSGSLAGGTTFRDCIGSANSAVVLVWASGISSMAAIVMAMTISKMNLTKTMDAWVNGAKSMLYAVMILVLALSLKAVVDDLHMAEYLVSITKDSLTGQMVPLLVFLLACGISFSTGTAWGTMAILMPVAIPVAWAVSGQGAAEMTPIIYSTIAAVLTGSIFGDHCSPISDTTILASLSSGSDHIAHVTTQMPYAVTVAVVSAVFGYLPAGFGMSPWISLILGSIAIVLFIRFYGKKINDQGDIVG